MTTPNELEVAIQDFIYECNHHEDNCDDCLYQEFCSRFYTAHCGCPDEWTVFEKSEGLPC